jgi:hypothetical protein
MEMRFLVKLTTIRTEGRCDDLATVGGLGDLLGCAARDVEVGGWDDDVTGEVCTTDLAAVGTVAEGLSEGASIR